MNMHTQGPPSHMPKHIMDVQRQATNLGFKWPETAQPDVEMDVQQAAAEETKPPAAAYQAL
eukprot:130227-Karenia_brevis.AAC.1